MKKVWCIILSIVTVMSLSACGKEESALVKQYGQEMVKYYGEEKVKEMDIKCSDEAQLQVANNLVETAKSNFFALIQCQRVKIPLIHNTGIRFLPGFPMNVCFPFDLGIGFHLFYNYIHTSSPLQSPICRFLSPLPNPSYHAFPYRAIKKMDHRKPVMEFSEHWPAGGSFLLSHQARISKRRSVCFGTHKRTAYFVKRA